VYIGTDIYVWHVYYVVKETINKTYVIPDRLDIRIKKQAAEERSTQSNIVVKAAEEYLKRNEK
jgi:hypothetical protein